MPVVLDVSAIVSLVFQDEDQTYAKALLKAIGLNGAYVPTLFWFEVRNSLVVNERRKRLTEVQTSDFLNMLAKLPIEIDYEPHESTVLTLARKHGLTVYDASYLELAQRRGLTLATNDRALHAAALLEGVTRWSPE